MVQTSFQFASCHRMERLRAYVNSTGFWFSSNAEQEEDAKAACGSGFLRPADDLLPAGRRGGSPSRFYVRASATSLPDGLRSHLVGGVPC